MTITVELTYDTSKEFGDSRIEIGGVHTVRDVVEATRKRFPTDGKGFEQLSRVTTLAVNGVLIRYRKGMKTAVRDGDIVAFVKAAAGG